MNHLLEPISDSHVCGEYLKANKTAYRALRNLFNQAQSSYRQLMESPEAMLDDTLIEANQNSWSALNDACRECLQNSAKDVEVFCWYISSQLFSKKPLPNLLESMLVFEKVLTTYWPDLQPKPDQSLLKKTDIVSPDIQWHDLKIKPLWQLAGESDGAGLLAMPLTNLVLIGSINYGQYFSAERAATLGDLKQQAQQLFAAEQTLITEKIHALAQIADVAKRIEAFANQNANDIGASSISFGFLIKQLNNLLSSIKYLLSDSFTQWPLDVLDDTAQPDVPSTVESVMQAPHIEAVENIAPNVPQAVNFNLKDQINSRDHAFTQLREIANYFQQTEPHSPIHMLLERAIRWGYMSLPQLLEEMVGDNEQVMSRINQMAGLESVEKTVIPKIPAVVTQQKITPTEPTSTDVSSSEEDSNEKPVKQDDSPSASRVRNFQW